MVAEMTTTKTTTTMMTEKHKGDVIPAKCGAEEHQLGSEETCVLVLVCAATVFWGMSLHLRALFLIYQMRAYSVTSLCNKSYYSPSSNEKRWASRSQALGVARGHGLVVD